MKKQYQSPIVRFESLRLRENIAEVCWGYDSNGFTGYLYYDDKDVDGYTKFRISTFSGSCSGNKDDPPRGIDVVQSKGHDLVSASTIAGFAPSFKNCELSASS